MKPNRLAALALAVCVTACGAVPSQPYLDDARVTCTSGNQAACATMPALQSRVNAEKQEQAVGVAGGILAVLGAVALGVAAGYEASQPVYYQPVVVVCHWRC